MLRKSVYFYSKLCKPLQMNLVKGKFDHYFAIINKKQCSFCSASVS